MVFFPGAIYQRDIMLFVFFGEPPPNFHGQMHYYTFHKPCLDDAFLFAILARNSLYIFSIQEICMTSLLVYVQNFLNFKDAGSNPFSCKLLLKHFKHSFLGVISCFSAKKTIKCFKTNLHANRFEPAFLKKECRLQTTTPSHLSLFNLYFIFWLQTYIFRFSSILRDKFF